ncbi:hypothetical protein ABZ863_24420 [Saccharomonospora sp. NPDC046836]|uniref:hypothetical protein n=1 Tax=Saccharomonospora sp. NPDC046836 TaxID=3156921 RepID=UPI0033D92520
MADKRARVVDGAQTVIAIAGVMFGLVPLVRWFFSDEHGGLFRWVFGTPTGAMGYVAPLLVIGAVVAVVLALEPLKRSRA